MVRPHVRPEDWVVAKVERASPTTSPSGYTVVNGKLPRLVMPDGSYRTAKRSYPLAAVGPDPDDPVDIETMTSTRAASGETHKLGIGKRNAHPHEWLYTGDGFTDLPLVAYIDGVAVSEFTFQRFGESDEIYDNPTMQGATQGLISIVDNGSGTAHLEFPEVFCPAPIIYRSLQPGADGAGKYEGCTWPLHYDPGGRQGPGATADHGEGLDQVSVWPDRPQDLIIEHNVGNRARVHRLTGSIFQRREWTGLERAPFRNTAGFVGWTVIERPQNVRWNTVQVYDMDDIESGPKYDKSAVLAAQPIDNHTIGFLALGNSFYTYIIDGAILSTDAQVSASGRVAIVLAESGSGLCMAMIAKINVDSPPFDGCRTPNQLLLQIPLFDWYDAYTHPQAFAHTGPYFQLNAYDDNGRAPGWCRGPCLVYIGDQANLEAALTEINASGLLEEDPPDLAPEVIAGTEWPPHTDPGEITVEYVDDENLRREEDMVTAVPAMSGVYEGAVAPNCGTGVRQYKATLRSNQTAIVNARPVGGASSAAVTSYTSLTVAGNRLNPPSTLVAKVVQTSAATGSLRLRVTGFDQFGERIVEETPSVTLTNKTNNYVYLSKVFAYVETVEFQSTGLDIADDTISIGTRWDWTRTIDASNNHIDGLNLAFGLPLRVQARANTSVTQRQPRYTRPKPIAAWATLSIPTNPSNTQTVTIDGKVYTFLSSLTSADGAVKIGGTAAESVANLYAAINLLDGAGTKYGANTVIHSSVSVLTAPTSTDLVVTAKTPGVLGNVIAVSETLAGAGNVWSGSYLEGGESDTGEVLRINVRDVSGLSSSAARPQVTHVDGRRILIGYSATGWQGCAEKLSILKQDAADQWGATAAVADLTIQTNPADTETVTIDGKVYTFQAVLADGDGNVLIGASAEESLANLRAAINLMAGAGTTYSLDTVVHPTVFAYPIRDGSGLSGVLRVQAKTVGTGGNALAVSETLAGAGNAWSGATLAGGSANIVDVAVDVYLRTNDRPHTR